MKLKHALTLWAFTLVLTGCVTNPTGFREQLATAEATHTSVIDALDSSLNAGTISSTTAGNLASQADDAQKLLEASKDAYIAGDTGAAHSKLTTAIAALTALQTYLRAQGAVK